MAYNGAVSAQAPYYDPLNAPLKEVPSKLASQVASPTVTEMAIVRNQVKDLQMRLDALESLVESLTAENASLALQIQALREGALLDDTP